jgi:hypothetical protein
MARATLAPASEREQQDQDDYDRNAYGNCRCCAGEHGAHP